MKVKKRDIVISPGWWNDEISMTVYDEATDREMASEHFSLALLCDEPAKHWHSNGIVDQYHYDIIKKIAASLRTEADRLDKVISELNVQTDSEQYPNA